MIFAKNHSCVCFTITSNWEVKISILLQQYRSADRYWREQPSDANLWRYIARKELTTVWTLGCVEKKKTPCIWSNDDRRQWAFYTYTALYRYAAPLSDKQKYLVIRKTYFYFNKKLTQTIIKHSIGLTSSKIIRFLVELFHIMHVSHAR